MGNLETILSKLRNVRQNHNGHMACCPAHDDHTPSLSITTGDDGRILIHCFTGCRPEAIMESLGMSMGALMPASQISDNNGVVKAPRPILSASGCRTADDAIAALERHHGKCTATWPYQNARGDVVGVVARWDVGKRKAYRPVSQHNGKWCNQGMASPRPLFHLPEILSLPNDAVVFVHEGEKAAEVARSISLPSTTSAHGARSARQTDWSPLTRNRVVVLPDNDIAGETYAQDVLACLREANPCSSVRIVRLPDLPPGGDIVDYIAAQRVAGLSDEAINRQIRSIAASEPLPTDDADQLSWRPFPTHVLPRVARTFVEVHAEAMNCDPSLLALPMLAMLAGCIGVARMVRIKSTWREPAIVWTAVVTPSGTMKTPALRATMEQLHRAQRREMEVHQSNVLTYHEDLARYDKAQAQWKKDPQAGERPAKPEPPAATRYIVSDATVEALAKVLRDNPRGLLMERDELAGWIGDLDRYAKSQGGDVTRWLSAWSAQHITVDRSGSDTIHIPRAGISVTGNIQPGVAAAVLRGRLRENGLAARLLMAMPPRRPSLWSDAEVDPKVQADLGHVVDRLLALEMHVDAEGRREPVEIPVLNEAKVGFVAWHNRHELETAGMGDDLSAAFSKIKGYSLRFAMIFQLVRWASNDATNSAVDIESMQAALELVEWWKLETKRVYRDLDQDPVVRADVRDVEAIKRIGGSVTVREWQRKRSFETSVQADARLRALEQAGHGTLRPAPQRGRGQPSMVFTLHGHQASDTDNNPAPASESPLVSVSDEADPATVSADTDWGEV